MTKAVDADRKRIRDELDALKDEVRAPLDALQAVIDGGVLGEDLMKDLVIAVASGKIPHLKIQY